MSGRIRGKYYLSKEAVFAAHRVDFGYVAHGSIDPQVRLFVARDAGVWKFLDYLASSLICFAISRIASFSSSTEIADSARSSAIQETRKAACLY
jgi:hypothetical protein